MPKGIKIDWRGDMAAIHVDAESVLTSLYEELDCTIAAPLEIHSGLVLWLDAEATLGRDPFNDTLTAVTASLGLDVDGNFGIYGPGVFLGGTATNPESLTSELRLDIVLKALRPAVTSN